MDSTRFTTLAELNRKAPDHDHWSTVENLAGIYSTSETLACWRMEYVPVGDIDLLLLHDDPDDAVGEAKIESIRRSFRDGLTMPAVVLIHGAGTPPHAYRCLEGMHRYNAAYREGLATLFAWVAHIGCCGGPDPDLMPQIGPGRRHLGAQTSGEESDGHTGTTRCVGPP